MSKKQQTFRRVLTFVLALVLALGFLSTVAFTVGAEDGNIDFDDLIAAGLPHGNCGEKVKWVLDGDMLIVSGTGPMKLESSTAPWYQYKDQITSVVVQDGVTAICDYAFMNMHHVTEVSIGKNVQSIGEFAFNALLALPSLVIPDNVKTIGSEAFGLCNTMTDLVIGDGVTAIDYYAFMNCDALQTVTIGTGLESFDTSIFELCFKLKNIVFDSANKAYTSVNGVVYSKDKTALVYVPGGITGSFVIPSSVTQIRSGALDHTYGLDSLTIPESVKKIERQSSGDMGVVKAVYYEGNAAAWEKVEKIGCEEFFKDILEFRPKVKITAQPTNAAAPNGQTAKVTVKATGNGLKYTWYHKNASGTKYSKSSVTSATYSVKMSSTTHGRYVYCVVTDQYGNTVTTKVVRVYMGNPAKLTAQLTNAAAPKGSTAKVAVKATGDGLKYTWYHKSAGSAKYSKSSVTSATYAVKTSSAVHGRYVYCVITDKYGTSVKTNVVRVYMGNPAKITTQPKSTVVIVGKTGKISVKATGDGLTYTWYAKNAGKTAYSKSSVTSNTYAFKMTDAMNGRQVYCVVKDKYGISVKSAVVTIKKANLATITTQPTNAAAPKGSTAKVAVKATGDGLTYQWYYAKKGSSTFKKISGATKATYSLKMSSSNNGRKVYCVVKDKYGTSVKTKTVTLYMGNPAKIVTQPKSVKVAPNQTAKVAVKATGDGLTYTWYHKSASAAKYSKSSVTSATYSVKMSSSVNGRYVYCVVKDKYGITVKTSTVRLYMGNPAKIVTQPKSVKVAPGQTAKVAVKATGDGLKYTWYHKSASATKYSKSSVTSATYSVKMSASVHGRYAYCVITDQYGTSVKTNVVRVYMGNPVKITAHPQNVTVAEGEVAKATVKATGDGLKYTWYQKDAAASAFTKSSVTAATYSVTMSETVDGRQVYCIVSDQYGNAAKSNLAILTMEAKKPQIDWTMGSWTYTGLYCEGEYNEFDIWFAGDGTFGTVNVAYWQVLSQEEINEYLEMGWSMEDFREIEGEYCANFHGTFRDFRVVNQKGNTLTLVVDYGEDGENIGTLVLELQEDKSLKILSVDNFVSDDALQAGKFFTWVEPEPQQMAMITSAPKGAFGDYGDTVTLTVEAEGENLTYQWYEIIVDEQYGEHEEVLLPNVTGNTYSVVLTEDNAGQLIYCKVLDDAYHFDHTGWMVVDYIVPSCPFDGFTAKVLNQDKDKMFVYFLSGDAQEVFLNIWSTLEEGEEPAEGSVPEEVDGVLYYPPTSGNSICYTGTVVDGMIKLSLLEGETEVAAIYLERTAYETLVVDHTTGTVDWIPGCLENLKPGTIFDLTL